MTSPSDIPEAAVEAALNARLTFKNQRGMDNAANLMRHILAAAAPHMRKVVTTMQDVDSLPVGSVLLDAFGELLRRDEDDDAPWCDCDGGAFRTVDLPATVLHEPAP